MFCTECGIRNSDGSKFCRECGNKIIRLEEQPALLPTRPSLSLNLEKSSISEEDSDRVRQLLDMAFWHSEAGHLPSALTACEAALKLDPFSSSALSLLGLIYEKQGNIDKAIEVFEKIVAINPGSVADSEKLDHLRQGIHDKAVSPPLISQLTPPIIVKASRKYPSLPLIIGASVSGFIVIAAIIIGLIVSRPAADQQSVNAGVAPSALPAYNRPEQSASASPYQNAPPVQPPAQASTINPLAAQTQATLEAILAAQNEVRRENREESARQAENSGGSPSIAQLQPLTVPQSDLPTHVVSVSPQQPPEADHVVDVQPSSQSGSSAAPTDSPSNQDADIPDAPASHIIVTVQGQSAGASPNGAMTLPDNVGTHGITLREDAGASLQEKGLSMQQAGNYKAAQAAYASAIAAFQDEIANGRNVDEAKRGIDACQVAIQICKQSQ